MQKNFYTILRKNNNDRAKTILGVVGLENRLVDAKDNIEFKEINYQGVGKDLKDMRRVLWNGFKNVLMMPNRKYIKIKE